MARENTRSGKVIELRDFGHIQTFELKFIPESP
jgi:hypothetical protein